MNDVVDGLTVRALVRVSIEQIMKFRISKFPPIILPKTNTSLSEIHIFVFK
jgi:hypothetical protein